MNLKKIGERVKTRRKMKGMSIAELAHATSMTPRSITLIEEGRALMDIECLVNLCTHLEMTPNELLSGEYVTTQRQVILEDVLAMMEQGSPQGVQEEPDKEEKDDVVRKDDETVMQEIRSMLEKYREEARLNTIV